jgi:hypothetical protein
LFPKKQKKVQQVKVAASSLEEGASNNYSSCKISITFKKKKKKKKRKLKKKKLQKKKNKKLGSCSRSWVRSKLHDYLVLKQISESGFALIELLPGFCDRIVSDSRRIGPRSGSSPAHMQEY